MSPGAQIANICKARTLRHREEVQNDLKDKSVTIEQAADPLPDDYDQAQRPFMLPLGHDPYDVWNHILDKVTDPKDVSNLRKVCRLFREMVSVKRKYVQTKLPQIVQLILDKRPKYLLQNEEDEDDVVSPSTSILLDLRLISRLCKDSVEKLLLRKVCLNLETIEMVQNIIDSILGEEMVTDTFFLSNLLVRAPWGDDNQGRAAFVESVGVLLELIGKRVKSIFYREINDTCQGVYGKLSEWVLHMPDLENLEVSTSCRSVPLAQLPTFEELPPFPHCPRLRSFKNCCKILPTVYLQRIFEANPQIKNLSLPPFGKFEQYPKPSEMNLVLPQLECLHTPPYPSLLNQLNDFQLPLKKRRESTSWTCLS